MKIVPAKPVVFDAKLKEWWLIVVDQKGFAVGVISYHYILAIGLKNIR